MGDTETLTDTSADDAGTATWSVDVPGDASYITGHERGPVTVSATKSRLYVGAPRCRAPADGGSVGAGGDDVHPPRLLLQVGEPITSR